MVLETVENLVLDCLKNNKRTRKDDFILYGAVLKRMKIDLNLSLSYILAHHIELKIPAFVSVVRARRKLQVKYPELCDEKTSEIREKQKEKFINYSRS